MLENQMYYQDWGFSLADVTAPVSLVYGGADTMCPMAWGEHLHERLPQSTLHRIEGAGHISVLVDGVGLILD